MNFNKILRDEIVYRDINIKEFAGKLDIPYSCLLSYVGKRKCRPRLDYAIKIANELHVSLEYLVTGKECVNGNFPRKLIISLQELSELPNDVQQNICELIHTIYQKRQIIEEINKQFGNWQINKIQARDIESFLIMDSHSGSWKNFYMETFNQICDETKWLCHEPVNRFQFTKFARNSKKADVFTNSEITRLFSKRDWIFYRDYLLFLTMYCCGLRIGEVRALQVEQILENQFLLINGFCKYDGTKTNYNKTGSEEHPKLRACPIPDYCYSQLYLSLHL